LLLLKRNLENRINARSYVHAVAKFSRYFDRSPDRLDLEDVRAFQVEAFKGSEHRGSRPRAKGGAATALSLHFGRPACFADSPKQISDQTALSQALTPAGAGHSYLRKL